MHKPSQKGSKQSWCGARIRHWQNEVSVGGGLGREGDLSEGSVSEQAQGHRAQIIAYQLPVYVGVQLSTKPLCSVSRG